MWVGVRGGRVEAVGRIRGDWCDAEGERRASATPRACSRLYQSQRLRLLLAPMRTQNESRTLIRALEGYPGLPLILPHSPPSPLPLFSPYYWCQKSYSLRACGGGAGS